MRISPCGEARIAGLRRLAIACEASRRQRGRHVDAVFVHHGAGHRARVVGSATVGPEPMTDGSSPGTSEISSVTTFARMRRGGEPPALDRGQVLAHAIHLGDVGAGFQQRLVDRLLVGQGQPFARDREQGGGAAGDQAEHEVVCGQALRHRQDAARGLLAGGVRHRVRRLDHLDPLARQAVAVARDDEAGERTGPVLLDRLGHRGGGLAGAEHDGAALGRRGQVGRENLQRIDRADGRREQAPQYVPIVGHRPSLCPALYGPGRAGQVEGATGLGGGAPLGSPARESAAWGARRRCRRGRRGRRRSGSRSGPRPG